MSDDYDFFATPRAGAPTPPTDPTAPGPAQQGYGTPAPGYGTPAPGYGAPGYGAPGYDTGQQLGAAPFGGAPQGPGLPYAPAQVRRPGTVVAAAVLVFIGAVFCAIAGALVLLGAAFLGALVGGSGAGTTDVVGIGGSLAFVGLVILAISGFWVLLGVKLLGGAQWAAVVVTVFSGISLAFGLLGLVAGTDPFSFVIGTAIPAATIVCLWTNDARRWFAG